jgi:enoyl-CoA hydratase/carnithine racemase
VLTVTLDRPRDQTRLTREVIATLQDLGDRLGVDAETQVVVVTGPADHLLAEAQALAARIAASGPLATRGAKRIVNLHQLSAFAAARTLSDTLRHALEWSRDVDEGMAAHREGRTPRFIGR